MLELLAPAGSMEALRAAVQNGADAVYLGAGDFNARMGARNFTTEELPGAVAYCHIRGVKVHLTVNTLVSDLELRQAADVIRAAARAGVDAFIVQDLGIVSLCKEIAPHIPVHASTQMSIHSLDGVKKAAELGCSRVVLARELPKKDIETICRSSPVEIEVFVHGALCMCYSGQCYMSGMIGQRSGNRGYCAQPCRQPYGYGRFEDRYPLSLKDNCLIDRLRELSAIGVTSLKIEGRAKRPEYVATVVRIYRKALNGETVTEQDRRDLGAIFSRDGFTSGYFDNYTGREMFGIRRDTREDKSLMTLARASYETGEHPLVPVNFYIVVQKGIPLQLAVEDPEGNVCKAAGAIPERALTRTVTEAELAERLGKTGGTPYYMVNCSCHIEPGLMVSAAEVNALRREALSRLTAVRSRPAEVEPLMPKATFRHPRTAGDTVMTVSVTRFEQITDELLDAEPAVLYIPLPELSAHPEITTYAPKNTEICAVMPRVVWDSELPAVQALLLSVRKAGVKTALTGNLGQIDMLKSMGFAVRGDYGLNLYNSRSINELRPFGMLSATFSFEMTFPQIRDVSKGVPMELIAYGRLPLMLMQNCVIRNRTGNCSCTTGVTKLVDKTGAEFPIVKDSGTCRNELLNGKKLYILDKRSEFKQLGVWGYRLRFTTESPVEVDRVLSAMNSGRSPSSAGHTRGLYQRGV